MSQSAFLDWLYEDGMGVLGWTETETLDTSLQGIIAALKGRNRFVTDILKAVFGGDTGDATPKEKTSVRPMTPELFDALFP
jgi:hypothetical protein